jgi:hypothetical protein
MNCNENHIDPSTSSSTSPPIRYEPILTLEQVAERLQLSVAQVRELFLTRKDNPLPALKAGKFLRFEWSTIEAWLDESGARCGSRT